MIPEDGTPCEMPASCYEIDESFCDSSQEWYYDCVDRGDGLKWSVTYYDGCPCAVRETPEDCASPVNLNPCTWVEPGCGPNPAQPSCQNAGVHADTTCDDIWCDRFYDMVCAVQSVNPCPDDSCGSCDAQMALCVPSDEP